MDILAKGKPKLCDHQNGYALKHQKQNGIKRRIRHGRPTHNVHDNLHLSRSPKIHGKHPPHVQILEPNIQWKQHNPNSLHPWHAKDFKPT